MSEKVKIVAITGPTATGKTALAVRMARLFDGEIISVDSRQVYRFMDLGTGKDMEEYGDIPAHLIDIAEPWCDTYNLSLFCRDAFAAAVCKEMQRRHKCGIACHDGRHSQNLGSNAQQECQHRADQGHGQAAAQAANQSGDGQNGVDTGAGDQLTEALGQSLEGDEQGQHQGGFRNKADLFVHNGSSFLCFLPKTSDHRTKNAEPGGAAAMAGRPHGHAMERLTVCCSFHAAHRA